MTRPRRAPPSPGIVKISTLTPILPTNTHRDSPKKDFKEGDLMGAIVVRFSK
jgi:hypothetical protein